MKILSFFIIAATMLAASENSDECGIITMTTSAECISFRLRGSGIALVDWGDGSEKDTVELEIADEYGWTWTTRQDLNPIPRAITISGKNITGLNCDGNLFIILDIMNRETPRCNQFTTLDVSRNTVLTYFDCSNNQLTELDVSKNTALTILKCRKNQLTEFDVSKNTALEILWCDDNSLTKLDVSRNTALKHLFCNDNQLTILDVSRNTALEHLLCYNNSLTELDVSRNTALIELMCKNNQLTELDVSKNSSLVYFWCGNNQFAADALNLLFDTLHDNVVTFVLVDEGEQIATKIINISNNPGSTDCDRSIAERKSWAVE